MTRTVLPLLLLVFALPAAAQRATPEARLPEVSVSATRTERSVDEIPATVTVIPQDEMELRQVRDIKDLIRYEPGVEVPTNAAGGGPGTFTARPNRPGNSGYSIRGIEGNRVQVLVDGIRVPDGFSFGSFAAPSRDQVDLDTLSRVEILRGPSSTLYGSDALGGVVSYTTLDPADLLARGADGRFAFGRAGYASVDEGWGVSTGGAIDTGRVRLMAIVTQREGHESGNHGSNDARGLDAFSVRTEPNPQSTRSQGLLAKAVLPLTPRDRLRFTLDTREQRSDFEALNARGLVTGTRHHDRLNGSDRFEHLRLSADWEHRDANARWLNGLRLTLYGLDSNTRQDTFVQYAATATGIVNRRRDLRFDYAQDTLGGQLQLETRAQLGDSRHRIVYGGEVFRQETDELRSGTEFNLFGGAFVPLPCLGGSGATGCAFAVENYPVRDFPKSTTTQTALFVQDEVQIGRLTLIPGMRHDHYRLRPEPDAIFTKANPGITSANLSFSSTTPKLGALWQLTDVHALWAQVARGFRAPPYNDVNIGFTNVLFGYTSVPNPNLKPETSTGVELGWRTTARQASFGLTWFDNRYEDFIDTSATLTCPGDPACSALVGTTFQSINRARVRIFGLEARGDLRFGRDWTVRGGFAWAKGDDLSADVPLNSIAPAKLVLGLQWGRKNGPYGVEGVMSAAARKSRVDLVPYGAGAGASPFLTPGYVAFDLFGWWRPSKGVAVQAGLFNVFDRKYWLWSNARLLSASAQNLDFFTQPGRNLSVSVRVDL